jgi:hypothetical protein
MIVSHRHRFIFLRLPKTASTSLAIALSEFCGPEDMITGISKKDEAIRAALGFRGPQHYTRPWYAYPLRDLVRTLIVRRRVPRYRHTTAAAARRLVGERVWAEYFKFCIERNPFDRAISIYSFKRRLGALPDVNEYICSLDSKRLSNWRRYAIDDEIVVDHVGRYEDLAAETAALARRLGLPEFPLPRTKTEYRTENEKRHYSLVLNREARLHIEKLCAREIERFSYQWTDAER